MTVRLYGGHAVSSTPALPAEIGNSSNGIVVATDTSAITASVGESVGTIEINGTEYGIFVKNIGSKVDFTIKLSEEDPPLLLHAAGLLNQGSIISIYKQDEGTYMMSAINLVW